MLALDLFIHIHHIYEHATLTHVVKTKKYQNLILNVRNLSTRTNPPTFYSQEISLRVSKKWHLE